MGDCGRELLLLNGMQWGQVGTGGPGTHKVGLLRQPPALCTGRERWREAAQGDCSFPGSL